MKKNFKIFLIFLKAFIIIISCAQKERLNPKDPLSPFYQREVVSLVSNIHIIYTNSPIINQDTTWTKSMSPIKVLQNLLITDGAVLTIEPGVEIMFYAIGNTEVGIIVDNGGLKAVGSISQPVKFYAIDGAFSYIVFRNVSIDSKCELKYCDLSEIMVACIGANPTIKYNKIMDLSLYSSSTPFIEFNNIATLNCYDSSPVVRKNLFYTTPFEKNILIDGNSRPLIYSNNIFGGSSYAIKNLTSFTQDAKYNYWGVKNTNEIKEKLWDFTDQSNLGPIIFQPYYTNQISAIGAGW